MRYNVLAALSSVRGSTSTAGSTNPERKQLEGEEEQKIKKKTYSQPRQGCSEEGVMDEEMKKAVCA